MTIEFQQPDTETQQEPKGSFFLTPGQPNEDDWENARKFALKIARARLTGSPDEAEDSVQEALVKTFDRFKRNKLALNTPAELNAYVAKAAYNQVKNRYRHAERHADLYFVDDTSEIGIFSAKVERPTEDVVIKGQLRSEMAIAFNNLMARNPDQATAIREWVSTENGRQQNVLALLFGRTISASKSLLLRGKRRLRDDNSQLEIYLDS